MGVIIYFVVLVTTVTLVLVFAEKDGAIRLDRSAAIEHGCAYYAPDTGEFTWGKP